MAEVRIGLIGSGYMGKAHALAYRTVPGVFALPAEPALELLADVDAATAERAGEAFGFARWTGAWRELVSDPAVDLVDITTPNVLHKEMAFAAIDAGKPVYCEKPLAPTAADAKAMVEHAEAAGVKTMVGFNYLKNPITVLAKEIVESGELGEVHAFSRHPFRGLHARPRLAGQRLAARSRSGDGVIVDLASHVVSLARYLVGGIDAVCADRDTVVTERRAAAGESATQTVEVADQVRTLLRFAGGAKGTIEASWIATGRKMGIVCEITGNKGALRFDFERLTSFTSTPPIRPGGARASRPSSPAPTTRTTRTSAWRRATSSVQRHQSDRGARFDRGPGRRRGPPVARFQRSLAGPARDRRHQRLGPRTPLGTHGRVLRSAGLPGCN